LPGCVTQGETLAEIKRNLKEAVELWLEAGQEVTRPRPEDRVLEFAV
jgi:predicted RNase H-like HicB family nuclease